MENKATTEVIKSLEKGFYWYTDSKDSIVVEKRDGEDFVRFTSGGRLSYSRNSDKFVGPLVKPV
jgi:hypothetical protein